MKKEYAQKIDAFKKKRRILLAITLFSVGFLTFMWFVPTGCESISRGHILFEGKQISPKQCWNVYGQKLIGTG